MACQAIQSPTGCVITAYHWDALGTAACSGESTPEKHDKNAQQAQHIEAHQRGKSAGSAPKACSAHTFEATCQSPGRRTRQNEDKRDAILRAGLALFSRYGLHGTSVDQIAARAVISKSNLLYHFASKEDLYVCVLRDLLDAWYEPLRGFSEEQDPAQAIGDYIRRKLTASRDRPEASRLFCLEMVQGAPLLLDAMDPEMAALVTSTSAVIRAWIASGKLAPVDPHHLIFVLWATTQHYADFAVQVQAVTGRTLRDPEFFEQTVQNVQAIVLGGVLARQGMQAVRSGKAPPARRPN